MTTRLTPKQVEGSTKGRGETCRQLRQGRGETYRQLRHRHQVGPNPLEDEQLQFSAFFKPRRSVIFFLRVRTGFGCLEKNLQQTDGVEGGVNSTSTNTARTEVHSISAHFITRTRVAQELGGSGLHIFVS